MEKLLFITPHLSTGGAPQFTLNRIELLKDTYDIYCIEYNFLSPHFIVQRNKIIDILGEKFFALGENKNNIIDIIKSINPDLISIEELSETFIERHLLDYIYNKERNWKIFETTHSSYNNSSVKIYLPDKFIFVSEWSKKMYSHFNVESEVIEYPIDKKDLKKSTSKEKLNFDNDYIHILNVGLFTPGKNQGYAFEIARKFLDKKVLFHFVGNQADNFKNYWGGIMENKPDNCIIWGERDDVEDFITASDMFLFTSTLELNPLVIKEVMCYDKPVCMFNLETYCGVYNNIENVSFLTGNVNVDVNKIKNILSIKEFYNNEKYEKAYVFYATEKYFNIVKKSVESIRQFSNIPAIVYLLNSNKKIDVENTITVNWECDISESDNMFINENENFYINRSNSEIYNILIQRPLIVKDALEKYSNIVAYVDSDSIATKCVDNIFDMYDKNLNYPYFVEGIYDFLIINGRGGASSKDDLTNTIEHPSCELFNVDQSVREKYRQTGYFVSGQNTIDFLNEWYEMCIHPEVLKNNEWYAPFNEETILNVLLWKKNIVDGLPYIYVNGTLETIDEVESIGFNGFATNYGDWFKIPEQREKLLFYHGEKRIDVLNKMIKKLKGLYYKNIKIADAGYVINLPHRIDRKESVIKTLNELEITGYEFIDGTIIEDNEYKKLGCTATYLKIFEGVLKSDLENIIVIEDDVKLMNGVTKNHLDKIFSKWNNTIKNYDVVALGVKLLPRSEIKINGETHGGFEEMLCSQSLFYHRHFIEHYVSQMKNYLNPNHYLYKCTVDMFLNDCSCEEYRFIHSHNHKKYNFGITIPMIFTQTDTFSDNEMLTQNYDNIMEKSFWDSLNKTDKEQNHLVNIIGSVDSKKTKEKYINIMKNTEIRKEENVYFNVHFVNQPFFEIKGNSDKKYDVEFLDSKGNSTFKTTLGTNMWSKLNRSYFEEWTIKVNSVDGFEKIIKYDAKGKRVYIAIDSSALGDTIAWIPYVEEFRKKWDCEVIVSTFWNSLFKNTYPNLIFSEPGIPVHNLYAMYKLGWFYNYDMEPELPNTIPLQKTATNILGLEYNEIKPNVYFKELKNPVDQKYIVISPYSTSGLKHWDFDKWEKLSEWLVSIGYKVINISKDSFNSKFVENLKDTSIENTINYINHSEFMIGLSSGLSWLSWALGKHVVMISNFTEPDHEFTSNCTRIINKSVCNGCWNNPNFKFDKGDWDWCPEHKGTQRQFECHKSITVDDVITKIKDYISNLKENNEEKHYDFIEIGTSDFDTLIESSDDTTVGISIEPIKYYLDRLPERKNVKKLQVGLSDIDGDMDIYYIPDEKIVEYSLPFWVRGTNSINRPHPFAVKEIGKDIYDSVVRKEKIKTISWSTLVNEEKIKSIGFLKIDTEGHDHIILNDYLNLCNTKPQLLADKIQFEFHPEISNIEELEKIILKFKNYIVKRNDMDVILTKVKNVISTEIEISIGEIVDKLSILHLKLTHISDSEKLKNISKEYFYLYDIVFNKLNIENSDFDKLVHINKLLWDIEDNIREKERNKEFDSDFIEIARSVYITNDIRADIKKELNNKYGSSFIEEKSYTNY